MIVVKQPWDYETMTAIDLFGKTIPQTQMVLNPCVPAQGLVLIYGYRGVGKTHLTLGIAMAIAMGGQFLKWRANQARKVLYIDGEMSEREMQDRLKNIDVSGGKMPSPDFLRLLQIDIQAPGKVLNLADPENQQRLQKAIGDAEVIIVDNISTLASVGKENDAESWVPIQAWALEQRKAGRTVIFVHHAGKGGEQRGTSKREDVMNTVIALRRPKDYDPETGARFEVHFEKARGFHGKAAQPFEASLSDNKWNIKELADIEMQAALALRVDGLSVREIANEMRISKSAVQRLLDKARKAGL